MKNNVDHNTLKARAYLGVGLLQTPFAMQDEIIKSEKLKSMFPNLYSEELTLDGNMIEIKKSYSSLNLLSSELTEEGVQYYSPGLFTSFKSIDDFSNAFKAPLMTPFVCLYQVIKNLIELVFDVTFGCVHIFTFNPLEAGKCFRKNILNLGNVAFFSMMAVVDTLRSLATLITRTGVSMGSLFCRNQLDNIDGNVPTELEKHGTMLGVDVSPY